MPDYRICLFFSDTGGGHRSATEAIEAAIKEIVPPGSQLSLATENIVEKSHPINRWFVDLYNYLLRHHQSRMKYYYWTLQYLQPNNSKIGYSLVARYVKDVIQKYRPAVIVSVHPMTNHYLARAIDDLGLTGKVKLITVITDPNANLWTGWACPQADLLIAPNDLARNKLVSWQIPPQMIKIMGMPIHPDFLRPPSISRQEFLTHLGLHSQNLTICINAGWAGGGNMLHVFESLAKVKKNIQVIFLCGHNQELFEKAKQTAKQSSILSAVLPFHDRLSDLMACCDLMVTKAGGLTTFEAVARRLPMAIDLITPAMPQEVGTAALLVEQGLAHPVRKPEDIIEIVENATVVHDRWSRPLPKAHSLDRTDAVYAIARTAMALCDPAYDPISGCAASRTFNGVPDGFTGNLGFEGPAA